MPKQVSLSFPPSISSPLRDSSRNCSLRRVIQVIVVIAGAILLGVFGSFSQQNPAVTDVSRSSFPVASAEIINRVETPPFCIPSQDLLPYVGSTRKGQAPIRQTFAYEVHNLEPGVISLTEEVGYSLHQPTLKNHALDAQAAMAVSFKINGTYPTTDTRRLHAQVKDLFTGRETDVLINPFPQKIPNYRSTISSIEEWLSHADHFSKQEICKRFCEAHRLLKKGIDEKAGSYRKEKILVVNPELGDAGTILNQIQKSKTPHASEMREQHRVALEQLPISAKQVEQLGYVAPSSADIPRLLEEFAKNMRKMVWQIKHCPDVDPIAVSAYALGRIESIQPFKDGNEEIAHIALNSLLKLGGKRPVVFLSAEDYYRAVFFSDQSHPGSLADFLQREVIPQTERWLSPERPCLERLSCAYASR